ncbi:hypothetical protein FHS35_009121 [Streptomyces umbrinus]|uniref:hypothetical protein n=1 Tax=Streptomyces umbrinus TaxID=67370 RepID=UPI00167CB22E|nr:hypothetical protein [Streptomyces umbrinus]MCR3732203.1 hypothetical protein [Streptomyces umbrinus]GHH68508.1 hypothetical protein GCM10018775_93080 [Streptomyces umbrinus]
MTGDPTPRRLSTQTKILAGLSVVLWLTVAASALDLALTANPTAPKGIIGVGLQAFIASAFAIAFYRQDRES